MSSDLKAYLAEIMLTEEQIQTRIAELGSQISREYEGRDLLLLGILKGSVLFMADLMRQITIPHQIDFLAVSSYSKGVRESTGVVRILKDLDEPIGGKDILIVEDIIDTGYTLSYLLQLLQARSPASIRICTLLSKPSRRIKDIPVDYIGFDIEDKYVFGYGLDLDQAYRNLPFIGVAKHGIIYSGK
jgi:hypoxanthine phosphoribosyltransferase